MIDSGLLRKQQGTSKDSFGVITLITFVTFILIGGVDKISELFQTCKDGILKRFSSSGDDCSGVVDESHPSSNIEDDREDNAASSGRSSSMRRVSSEKPVEGSKEPNTVIEKNGSSSGDDCSGVVDESHPSSDIEDDREDNASEKPVEGSKEPNTVIAKNGSSSGDNSDAACDSEQPEKTNQQPEETKDQQPGETKNQQQEETKNQQPEETKDQQPQSADKSGSDACGEKQLVDL